MKQFLQKKVKKVKNNKIILELLFDFKNYRGTSINIFHQSNLNFLYGFRGKQSLINLRYTLNFLKSSLNFLKPFIDLNKKILIVLNCFNIKNEKKFILPQENIKIIKGKWPTGFLTNSNQKFDIIIIFNNNKEESNVITNEATIHKIPIINILNTNQNINNIEFPILSNNNPKSLFILLYFFNNFFKLFYTKKNESL